MIIWINGLSGAGKSTAGRLLYERWKAQDPATVLIDGDEVRRIFRHDQNEKDYSLEGRRRNAERISEMCAWLDRQNINVVCCILSIFQDLRDWNRTTFSSYFEVYLDVPLSALEERRTLYADAREGRTCNVVGVDIPFTPPKNPDLALNSGPQGQTPEGIADIIFTRALGAWES